MPAPPHRVLVIGVGSIGERHTRCFQTTGRATVSICETKAQLRNSIAERYEISHTFAALDEALAHPHDAAVVATPAPLHVDISRKLAQSGWHMLIEKPLSISLDGIAALLEEVAAKQVKAAVGYCWRNHPALIDMNEAIASGRFGKPVHMTLSSGQHFPAYRPAYREIYYARRESGGGAIQDGLTHMLNLGEWLAGPIVRVAADAAHQVLEGVTVEDTVNVLARQGSVLASYSLNQHQAPNEMTITVVCERGTLRFESHRCRWRWMAEPEPNGQWQDEPHEPLDRDYLYVRQAHAFLDTIEDRREPVCSLAEGTQTLRVNLAVLAAAESQCWCDV